MDWDWANPFTISTTVDESDIDGLRHTNNAVYVKWCEQAAWAHSASLGLDLDCYRKLDRAMVITHSEFDYLQASYCGDALRVATWIVTWDGKLTNGATLSDNPGRRSADRFESGNALRVRRTEHGPTEAIASRLY